MRQRHFHRHARAQAGFTLVEAIIVIVVTGIVAAMTAAFIRLPVQSYVDTEARADMADAADLALRRMSRELRLALPFSIGLYNGNQTIQFLLTKTGARYIVAAFNPPATLLPLDFVGGNPSFDIVGAAPTGRQAIVAGDYIVIANSGVLPADAYAYGAGADNISRVAAINGTRVTLQQNRFASTVSEQQMFQVVTGTVTYVCTPAANGGGTLQRYFTPNIVRGVGNVAALGTPALMTDMVAGCAFNTAQLAGRSGTLMTMALTLQRAGGESARLVRQTQLDNPI
jgi:MSHA biogenesis protein MshO